MIISAITQSLENIGNFVYRLRIKFDSFLLPFEIHLSQILNLILYI